MVDNTVGRLWESGVLRVDMLRGLYAAANAMRYRAHEVDVLANNLANVSTHGYKRDRLAMRSFGDILATRMNDVGDRPVDMPPGPQPIGVMNLGGPAAETEFVDFSSGTPQVTGNPLDLYLEGPGFFAVRTPQGTRYTRAGQFSLNPTGEIVNQSGHALLGVDNDPITIMSAEPIRVGQEGTVTQNGIPVGQIQIVEFADLRLIEKEGLTLFRPVDPNQAPPWPATSTSVEQGTLESSNVDAIDSLVRLISAQRAYEAAARAVDMFNQSMTLVSGELGRLPV